MTDSSQKEAKTDLTDSLPWEEISTIAKKGKFKKIIESISEIAFKFAASKTNKSKVAESALKMLQQTDPENATKEHAEEMAEIMQIFARGLIKDENMRK